MRGCYRVDKPRKHPASARPKVSMSSLTEDTRRRLCSLVAGVVCADDVMTPDERHFLQRVMVRLGVETDTVLMPIYGEDAATEFEKLPRSMRRPALELAIVAAAVDGKVVSSERAIVDAMARQVGMGTQEVELRLARALRRPDSGFA
jgi:tellurite resistance protein